MTDQELIERGNVFKSFVEHQGWTLLLQEVRELLDLNISQVMSSNVDPMFFERGLASGMAKVLSIPIDAVEEATRIINTKTDQAEASQ